MPPLNIILSEAAIGTYSYESLDLLYDKPIRTSDILTVTNDARIVEINGTVLANKFSGKSDARLKHDISNITNALDTITLLCGRKYIFNGSNSESYGFIAQEVMDVLPSIVHTDQEKYLSISYFEIIPFLLESIKELNEKIKIVEQRIL